MTLPWKRCLAGAALFALGAAAGSWAQRLHGRRHHRAVPDPAHIVARLDRELSLDSAQKAAVLAALVARRPEVEALHKRTFEQMEALLSSIHADIRKTLKPDQQAKLEAFTAKMLERRRRDWGLQK